MSFIFTCSIGIRDFCEVIVKTSFSKTTKCSTLYKVTTTANITLLGSTNQTPEFNRAKLNLYAWSGTNKTDVGCVRAEYAYQLSYLIVTPKKYISIDQKVNLSLVRKGSQSFLFRRAASNSILAKY